MRELKQTWHDLLLGFRVALDFRKMGLGFGFLALIAIIFLLGAWALLEDTASHLDGVYQREFQAQKAIWLELHPNDQTMGELGEATCRNIAWDRTPTDYEGKGVLGLLADNRGTIIRGMWQYTLADMGFVSGEGVLGQASPRGLTWLRTAILVVAFLVVWFFMATWFGAISRLAVVEIARDERPSLSEALHFARKKRRSFFWAPLGPPIFFVLIYLAIALWGAWCTIPWAGPLLGVLALPLVLFGGFLMAMLALGGVFGGPLMAPALAAEGSDSFDAISRAFSYVFSRPWHYAWYLFVTVIHGIIVSGFVFLVTCLTIFFASIPGRWAFGESWTNFLAYVGQLPRWLMTQIGWGPEVCSGLHWVHQDVFGGKFVDAWMAGKESAGSFLPFSVVGDVPMQIFTVLGGFFLYLMIGLMTAFVISYWLTQWSMIYFLLRHKVDGTDTSEIYYEAGEDPWAPLPADTAGQSDDAPAEDAAPATDSPADADTKE